MTENHDFECVVEHFSMCCEVVQRVAPPEAAPLCNLLQRTKYWRRVATKIYSTQWLGGGRNSATLLFFKIINIIHTHTYAYAYRGSNRGVFEMLRPLRLVVASCRPVGVAMGALRVSP